MSGYDGRGAPAMLLSYMTADIGAHHNRSWTITMDEDLGKNVLAGKAKVVVYLQHIRPFFDTVSCCRLFWGEVDVSDEEHIDGDPHDDRLERLHAGGGAAPFRAASGTSIAPTTSSVTAAPGASTTTPTPGSTKRRCPRVRRQGARLTLEDLDLMLDEYYVARGWGKDGNPSREVLLDLGLDECVANLEREGLIGDLTSPLPPVRGERYKPKAF